MYEGVLKRNASFFGSFNLPPERERESDFMQDNLVNTIGIVINRGPV